MQTMRALVKYLSGNFAATCTKISSTLLKCTVNNTTPYNFSASDTKIVGRRYKKGKFGVLTERWFVGVVVITSALHAEGLGFEPRTNLFIRFFAKNCRISPLSSRIITIILSNF